MFLSPITFPFCIYSEFRQADSHFWEMIVIWQKKNDSKLQNPCNQALALLINVASTSFCSEHILHSKTKTLNQIWAFEVLVYIILIALKRMGSSGILPSIFIWVLLRAGSLSPGHCLWQAAAVTAVTVPRPSPSLRLARVPIPVLMPVQLGAAICSRLWPWVRVTLSCSGLRFLVCMFKLHTELWDILSSESKAIKTFLLKWTLIKQEAVWQLGKLV